MQEMSKGTRWGSYSYTAKPKRPNDSKQASRQAGRQASKQANTHTITHIYCVL